MKINAQKHKNLGWILLVFLLSTIAIPVLMIFIPNPLILLVFLLVVFAIFFFILHSDAGLYLLVLLLPFQELEVVIGPIGVSPVDLVVWPWLLAYGTRILFSKWRIKKSKLLLFVAFWVLTTLISGVVAMNKGVFLVVLGSRAIYAMILIASSYELSKRPGVLRAITNLYISVALFVALFGALQLVGLVPNPLVAPFSGQLIGGSDRQRMASLLSNANLLAGYLSVAIFFSWMKYRQSSGGRRLKYFAAFIILMVATLFTFSRAGFMGIAAGAMILYMGESREKLGKRFFKLVIGVLVATFVLVVSFGVYRMLFDSTGGDLSSLLRADTSELDKSNQLRLVFWEMAVNMYKSSPIIGVGAGQFMIQFEYNVPFQYSFLESVNAHNTYLQILAESGLLGLVAFLALFGYIVLTALRAKGSAPVLKEEVNAALAGLVAILVIGVTHDMVKTYIWLVAGLVLAYTRQYQASREPLKVDIRGGGVFQTSQL